MSGDADVIDLEAALDQIVKANVCTQFIQRDWKVGILHLSSQRFTQ